MPVVAKGRGHMMATGTDKAPAKTQAPTINEADLKAAMPPVLVTLMEIGKGDLLHQLNRNMRDLVAAIDYHGAADPGSQMGHIPSRCTHTATLQYRVTQQARVWFENDGSSKDQAAFADFLEDYLHHIIDPDGADLMELVQTLNLTEQASFKSRKRMPDGNFAIDYSLDAATGGGVDGQATIPSHFVVAIPIYEGDPQTVELKARLRFKLHHGQLVMWYSFTDAQEKLRTRLMALCGVVEEKTKLPVYQGAL